MVSKRTKAALLGAGIGVAIAHFDLMGYVLPSNETTRMEIKSDAPGIKTNFESGWGLAQKQQLGIDDRWHAMLQLPFGVQAQTATVTLMLGVTGTAFGISVGAKTDDTILLSLMQIPDPTCDPTAPTDDATLTLGSGAELIVKTDCLHGDNGFAREYVLQDDQRQTVTDYLVNTEVPTIAFAEYGPVPFVMTGYPEAVEAALAGPRVVPDEKAVGSSESNALVLK